MTKRREGATPRSGCRHGGRSFDPVYNVWYQMLHRCLNPKNKRWDHYGGRGVKVCDRWLVFGNFVKDMGDPPVGMTLDRKDNDGNYTPENCRWATESEQCNNRSISRMLTLDGETRTIAQWAPILGLKYHTLYMRLRRGIDPKKSLTNL
jgi:hypothetical protein